MKDLTANPDRETLEEVAVMGRTVYVSHRSKEAYVEFQDELVSMTNLRAWNHLMEQAKQEVIDGYEEEKSLEDKELERRKNAVITDIRDMARELDKLANKVNQR